MSCSIIYVQCLPGVVVDGKGSSVGVVTPISPIT